LSHHVFYTILISSNRKKVLSWQNRKSARSKSCSPRKTAPSQEDVKKAQTSAEKAKKAEEKSKAVKENKSGSKAEAKALPNTAAVK